MNSQLRTIYITPKKLFLMLPKARSESSAKVTAFTWDHGSLPDVIEKIKSTQNCSRLKVLVSEEISFTTTFLYTEKKISRDKVFTQFQSEVPEEVPSHAWDYKIVTQQNGVYVVQAFAVKAEVWNLLTAAVKKHAMRISMAVPSSYTIAHHLPESHKPALLVYVSEEESFAAVLVQNHVFGVITFAHGDDSNRVITKITELVQLVVSRYGVKPALLLLPKIKTVPKVAQPFLEEIEKKGTIPHPFVVLSNSAVESGEDASILTLSFGATSKKFFVPLLVIFGIVLFVVATASAYFFLN